MTWWEKDSLPVRFQCCGITKCHKGMRAVGWYSILKCETLTRPQTPCSFNRTHNLKLEKTQNWHRPSELTCPFTTRVNTVFLSRSFISRSRYVNLLVLTWNVSFVHNTPEILTNQRTRKKMWMKSKWQHTCWKTIQNYLDLFVGDFLLWYGFFCFFVALIWSSAYPPFFSLLTIPSLHNKYKFCQPSKPIIWFCIT